VLVIETIGAILGILTRESLMFAAVMFSLIGAEDVTFDLVWIASAVRNRIARTSGMRVTRREVGRFRFGILVPAWDEAAVIGSMIDRATACYDGHDFMIFVGAYPNDPTTLAALNECTDERVVVVCNARDGPTTKGDALNTAWDGLVAHERESAAKFDFIILHDAEDIIAQQEPDVFSACGHRYDFMQIPVVPMPVQSSRWVAGHYCDEFAEAHVKSMVVRTVLNASVPSAGVGTAVGRSLLDRIARNRGGLPFSPDSLTEDYELGLLCASLGASSAFLRVADADSGRIVCVRSRFPETISAAVRQKARWIAGIAFAGWDRMGWSPTAFETWMRWRDRRAMFEAAALVAGYGGLLLGVASTMFGGNGLSTLFDGTGRYLLWSASAFMCWRLVARVLCTTHVYGWREGVRAALRVVVSNLIAVMATIRAIRIYWRMRSSGKVLWDKTQHNFAIGDAA
jgi:bacteriophage N4 adsorption protein B